jgi:hypothetical protein
MSRNALIDLGLPSEVASELHLKIMKDAHDERDYTSMLLAISLLTYTSQQEQKERSLADNICVNQEMLDAFFLPKKMIGDKTKATHELKISVNWIGGHAPWSAECLIQDFPFRIEVRDNDVCRAIRRCFEAMIKQKGVEISDAITKTQPPPLVTP